MDPWSTNRNQTINKLDGEMGFQDSFCEHQETYPVIDISVPAVPHGGGTFNLTSEEYLQKLETKLTRVSESRKEGGKLSASMMIDSLQSQKHMFFENMERSYSSYDEYDDFSSSNNNFKAELRRKFNPEQQALSQVELLCLPDNDVLSNNNTTSSINFSEETQDASSSSDTPDH